MNRKKSISSVWGLTVILSIIVFGVIVILVSFFASLGIKGVRSGKITETALLERPGIAVLAICIISLILGIVIMVIIQKFLISPIKKMTEAVRQLAVGNFDTRINSYNPFQPKELRDFSESFNKTAERLSSVEILRNDFINNFSHEFKTPINSLVGIAELLKTGDCSPEKTAEYLDVIIDQSKRLAALSANVLYLTKLETGAASFEMEQINLSELLRRTILLFDHKCGEKELELNAEIQPAEVYGNSDLLSQMMSNILDNAIKFSPEKSKISVELSEKESRAVFRVTDRGCGMDKETVGRIFDKFYQGDTSHSAEGFGLGLPMVKKIVELHHGQLKVESKLGKGSVFTIELPTEK